MKNFIKFFLLILAFPAIAQEGITLNKLLKLAIERNPQIKSLREQVEAQRFRITIESSLPEPIFGISIKNIGLDRFSVGEEMMSGISFVFSQAIPFPGKLRLKGEIAKIKSLQAEENLKAATLSLKREIKELYSSLFHYHKSIEILKKKKVTLEEALKTSEIKYSVGEGTQSDIFKAQLEISRIEEMLISMNQMLKAIEGKINSLLDLPQENPLGKPEEINFYGLKNIELNKLYEEAKKSPFFKSVELIIDEHLKRVEFSKKEFYPNIMIQAGKEFKGYFRDMYEIMIGLEIPIYYKKKQVNMLRESISNLRGSKNSYESIKNQIFFMLNENYIMAKASENLLKLYKERIIPQAELSLESSLANYRVGKVDFLTLLSDIDNLFSYEIGYFKELSNLWIAVSKIEEFTNIELLKEDENAKIN
ncbi:MAG: TolC family protein [Candidatus Aminicenantia bacterium]